MHVTTGTFSTPNGGKYIRQLCKHFAHKIETGTREAENGGTEGELHFEMGTAYMSADPQRLTVRFELENDDALAAAQHVIDGHLERFAFREDFKHMDWDRTQPPERRSVKRAAADLLRARLPGLHAALRDAVRRFR